MKNFFLYTLSFIVTILLSSIITADTITLTFNDKYPPFSYEEDGKVKGIEIDLAIEILKKLDIKVVGKAYPWARAQHIVKFGKADGFITIPTDKRSKYCKFSKLPFFTSDFLMYTGVGNPRIKEFKMIKTLDQLKKTNVNHICVLESGWHLQNLKDALGPITKVKSSKKIVQMLDMNRADIYVEQWGFLWLIKKMGIEKKIVEIPNVLDTTYWHMCIGKKSPFIKNLPKLDILMEQMNKDGSLQKVQEEVYKKYK